VLGLIGRKGSRVAEAYTVVLTIINVNMMNGNKKSPRSEEDFSGG